MQWILNWVFLWFCWVLTKNLIYISEDIYISVWDLILENSLNVMTHEWCRLKSDLIHKKSTFFTQNFIISWEDILTTYVMKTPLPLVLCIILKPNLSLMLPFLSSTVMNFVGPEQRTDSRWSAQRQTVRSNYVLESESGKEAFVI